MDWSDNELLVKDALTRGDPVAQSLHGLKLYSNHNYYNDAQVCQCIAMLCWIYMCGVPYRETDFSDEDEEEEEVASKNNV